MLPVFFSTSLRYKVSHLAPTLFAIFALFSRCDVIADKAHSIMAKAIGLDFFTVRPNRCLLAYRSTCNAFFMDLPVSFFVSHSSSLTVKGVNLMASLHNGNRPYLLLLLYYYICYCAEIKKIVVHRCDHNACSGWYKTHLR